MMDDHGSKRKKKKKRGKSLIFKNFFKPATPGDDHSSSSGRKALASDDNLIYCDVSDNCVDPNIKKSSSSRMSRIFKAVLFDTAVKKKIHGNDSSETPNESQSSSPVRDNRIEKIENRIEKIEKIDDSINERNSDVVKIDKIEKNDDNPINEIEKNSNSEVDRSIQLPLPSKPAETPVSSSTITAGSQTLTERKVNAVDKKPPLPSNPRPQAKPIPAEESKQVASNNPPLFIFAGFLVLVVVLWKIYAAIAGGSSDIAITGDEL